MKNVHGFGTKCARIWKKYARVWKKMCTDLKNTRVWKKWKMKNVKCVPRSVNLFFWSKNWIFKKVKKKNNRKKSVPGSVNYFFWSKTWIFKKVKKCRKSVPRSVNYFFGRKLDFYKKDPPEKMMQNELKINSIALLTSLFRHFLFLMKNTK